MRRRNGKHRNNMQRMVLSIFFLLIRTFPAGRGKITPSHISLFFFAVNNNRVAFSSLANTEAHLHSLERGARQNKRVQNVPKSQNSFVVFLFWVHYPPPHYALLFLVLL